ncbi:hypothetical protein V1511DRAFT_485248 [Dipodascopsis uninucleata]
MRSWKSDAQQQTRETSNGHSEQQEKKSPPARHFGRGGAGNITTQPDSDSSPAPLQVFTSPDATFHTGRGGYGNIQSVDNLSTMSPDQYLQEVDDAIEVKKGDVYKIGRGGTGNIMVEGDPSEERTEQGDESFLSRLTRPLSATRSRSRSRSAEPRRS